MKQTKRTNTGIEEMARCKLSRNSLFFDRIKRCTDCICLTSDEQGNWFCEEANKKCLDVETCPEGLSA